MKFAIAAWLALALIAASAGKRAGAQDAAHATAASASLGMWGGPDIEMEVTEQGAALDFDCALGTILEPLLLDAVGKFQAKGTFHSQHGGPIKKNQPSRGIDVLYSGIIQGDTMRLEFTLGESKESPQKFTLVRGQAGNLRKCR